MRFWRKGRILVKEMTSPIQTLPPTRAMRWVLTAAVVVPYLISLGLPAVTGDIDEPNTTALGLQALVMGILVNPIAWLANMFLPIGLVLCHADSFKGAAIAGAAAAACAAIPLVVPLGFALESGYYVWSSSMLVFLVGSFLCWHLRQRAEAERELVSGSTPA